MSRSSSSTVACSVCSLPLRITFSATDVPGLIAVTIFWRSVVLVTGRPLNSMTTSPGFDAGLFRGTAPAHALHERAGARLEPEVLVALARHGRHRQADAAADDLAVAQLRQEFAHRVDRHGEAEADVPLGAPVREDHRVDPDDLAAQVQQRAARVARD